MYQVHNVQMLCIYMSIVDLHADTNEAMEMVISKPYKECGIGKSHILVGNQKSFSRIHKLKHIKYHGSELDHSWLIPFIGDWHLLSNYDQSVLMKV